MTWIQDFSRQKPRTVFFASGDDTEAKNIVIAIIDSVGFVTIDLGPLANGSMGGPLSGIDLHFVQRLHRA
jgi:predicted dinucleotide-binding enzyme